MIIANGIKMCLCALMIIIYTATWQVILVVCVSTLITSRIVCVSTSIPTQCLSTASQESAADVTAGLVSSSANVVASFKLSTGERLSTSLEIALLDAVCCDLGGGQAGFVQVKHYWNIVFAFPLSSVKMRTTNS